MDTNEERQWPVGKLHNNVQHATGWYFAGPVFIPWYGDAEQAAKDIAEDVSRWAQARAAQPATPAVDGDGADAVAEHYGFHMNPDRQASGRFLYRYPDGRWLDGSPIPEIVWNALLEQWNARSRVEQETAVLRGRVDRLEETLRELVNKLDAVHADPKYKNVWVLHQIHGGRYDGLTYTKELERARAALKEGQ